MWGILIEVGDSGVGKSSIIMRYTENHFSENLLSTIGIDFRMKQVPMNGDMKSVQIWDTAGRYFFLFLIW